MIVWGGGLADNLLGVAYFTHDTVAAEQLAMKHVTQCHIGDAAK